jgi:hypothetical protein
MNFRINYDKQPNHIFVIKIENVVFSDWARKYLNLTGFKQNNFLKHWSIDSSYPSNWSLTA